LLRLPERREALQNETIDRLIALWEPLEQDRQHLRFPNWWKRHKPTKREQPRLSIRTWNNRPDWHRMISIYWTISGWMHNLYQTSEFPYVNEVIRNDAIIAAWKLAEFSDLLYDGGLKDFIERLQQLGYAIVVGIDSEKDV
jgi:hypothetical protein